MTTAVAPSLPRKSQSQLEGSVKDTIESILVAFMLAFIFRAFVVEAFVIPTGSMAPTLMGAHTRFRCPDCGYRFDVNYSAPSSGGDDIDIPSQVGPGIDVPAVCPNCGYLIQPNNAADEAANATNPAVHYGDRILVLKYLYLLQEPKRWDVVVFKAPVMPKQYDYSQNYIKRLIGKPGESILVLDGDVYVGHGPELSDFHIQTKPDYAQDAMWRIVYDNDYHPRGIPRSDWRGESDRAFVMPWKTDDSAWAIGDGSPGHRDFAFNAEHGTGTLHFDNEANPLAFSFTDSLAYDIDESHARPNYFGDTNVSDVKLSATYQRRGGAGPLSISLSKINHHFEAQLTDTQATLLMDGTPIAGPVSITDIAQPAQIDFQNVDYHVSLRVNGKVLLESTPQQYEPDKHALLEAFRANNPMPKPKVNISATDQQCTLTHVSLWRDVYYINRTPETRQTLLASPVDFPNHVAKLGPDEFFVMGDNSIKSLDARYWTDPIDLPNEQLEVASGRVPRRFMLGKAFFVYWPAGYRPMRSTPGIIPNFGDMRFIH